MDVSFPLCTPYHGSKIHIVHVDPDFDEIIEISHIDCKNYPYKSEGYYNHVDPKSGIELPFCCVHHRNMFEEANRWYARFPNCCDHHQGMLQEGWFIKADYDFLPKKIVQQVHMTEYLIDLKIHHPRWYEEITGYIDQNFTCFGGYGIGLNIYFNGLEQFIHMSRDIIPAEKARILNNYINHARNFYSYSYDWYSNHPLIQDWLRIFPFDIEFMEHLKREFLLFEVPLPFDRHTQQIKYNAVPYTLKEESITSHLRNLTKKLLSKIKSSSLYKTGILSKDRTKAVLLTKQFDLKYSDLPENTYVYVEQLEQWFNDMIELLDKISGTPETSASVLIPAVANPRVGIIESPVTEIPERLISFNNRETLERVYDLLKGFFPDKEDDLKNALEGKKLEEPLFFQHQQNQLVEFFRRLKYNGFIPNTSTEIRDWLCLNFQFRFNKGSVQEVRSLNPDTVWAILSKEDGDLQKSSRIGQVDWLPYKNHEALKLLSQEEKK